jgi:hypothetical protein
LKRMREMEEREEEENKGFWCGKKGLGLGRRR